MRQSFEQNITQYNEIAKDELRLEEGELKHDQEMDRLSQVIEWQCEKAAERRATTSETQQEIYDIQKKKQEIFQTFKEQLKEVDNPKFVPLIEQDKSTVQKEGDGYVLLRNDDTKTSITIPELMADCSVWNVQYNLDASIPRMVRREYLLECTKHKLRNLLDQQIAIDESESMFTHDEVKKVYQEKISLQEGGVRNEKGLMEGFIAEKMVQSFLKKCAYSTNFDFEIIPADIFEDINKKIDFIIHRKKYNRGVDVTTAERNDVGVQFTTNTKSYNIQRKEEQIERAKQHIRKYDHIDDIVLVSIPIKNSEEAYKIWKAKKIPGGPDTLWDMRIKEVIFKKVLEGMCENEEVEAQWKKVVQNSTRSKKE